MDLSRHLDNGIKKFDQVVTSFGFVENKIDNCISLKMQKSNFIFMVFVCG